ncbi:Uncharacterised protein [Shigella flexneri]|nr:Uncharacterised protein [Shigella flexneri]
MAINIVVCHYRTNTADEVSKGGYRRPRNDVIRPGILAHAHGANRHPFHCAGQRPDSHQISSVHAVFKLNKYPGDNIFYQRLRTKRDSQT